MQRTQKAIESCAKWLVYCLSIGWQQSDLDKLDQLWWQYHDEYGQLR